MIAKRYYDYEAACVRLLQLCVQLRDAIDGQTHVEFVSNGLNAGILKRKELLAPAKNIYYAVDVLLPEIIFSTLAHNTLI